MPSTPPNLQDDRRYAWRVVSVTSLGVILATANTSTLDVGLPVVARHFHASATAAAWTLLSYMLVTTVLILVFGRLADIVGRRRLYLAGLATLTAASFACGFAPSIVVLDGLRAVQAVGAAAIITNTTAQITDVFPPERLGVGLGVNVTVSSAAQVAGPLLGGLLAGTLGWRALFLFNVPTGVIGLVWARISLRHTPPPLEREPLDLWGSALSFVAVGGLLLALAEGGALGWTSLPVVAGAAAFVLGTPLFLLVQSRRRHPLVDLSLFADRDRSLAYLAAFLVALSRFSVVLLVALYVQAADGASAFRAGAEVIPVALGTALASPLAGRLARRDNARVVSSTGLAVSGAAFLGLAALLHPRLPYLPLGGLLLACGIGSGLFLTPNTRSIMAGVAPGRRGIANGVRSMVQNTGYATSVALSLAIVTGPLAPPEKRAAYAGTLRSLSGASLHTFTHAYHLAFLVLAALTAVGVVASASRRRAAPDVAAALLDTSMNR